MSLDPSADGPAPGAQPRAFSVSAAIELARGILARGFLTLLLSSLVLLVVQLPPQALAIAQGMSQQADRRDPELMAAAEQRARSHADEGSDAQGESGVRGAIKKALMSDGPDPSARTVALGWIANCFSIVWGLLVQLPVSVGAFLLSIRIARGEMPGIKGILHGYRRLPAQMGAVILQYLATIPLYAVTAAMLLLAMVLFLFPDTISTPPMQAGAVAAGGVLLLLALPVLIVATWIAMRLTFTVLAVADPAMGRRGPAEAIGVAWRTSRGHVLSLIVLFLLAFAVAMVTALCCLAPLFVIGLPVVFALFSAAWLLLMRHECPDAPPTIVRGHSGTWALPGQHPGVPDPAAVAPADFRG